MMDGSSIHQTGSDLVPSKLHKGRAILQYAQANPHARNCDISRALGVHEGYVSVVLQKAGLTPKRGSRLYLDFFHQPALYGWLHKSTPKGLTVNEYAVSLLIDVMHDELEGEKP